jgi:carbon-monoxide dehydrogenase large subunit
MTGNATHAAALKVRAKALDVAASLLQASPDELDIVDGVVSIATCPAEDRSVWRRRDLRVRLCRL